jgi:hypothetical protein
LPTWTPTCQTPQATTPGTLPPSLCPATKPPVGLCTCQVAVGVSLRAEGMF